MSEISPLNAIGNNVTQNLLGSGTEIMGKDDFLKILVAQLQNQDPMDPSNPEEFASQLAQFSSLEQMQNINRNLLDSMGLNLQINQAINNTMATTLIGRSVKAGGNKVELTDDTDSANLHFDLAATAKTVKVEIRDAEGNLVRTLEINDKLKGDHKIEWDGKNNDGEDLKNGKYTFTVKATDIEGENVEANEYIVGMIDSIRYANGEAILLIGGLQIGLDAVMEIGYGAPDGGDAGSDPDDEESGE